MLIALDRQNRPAELLAKFLDVKLKGEKGVSDDDVEAILERVMVLFRQGAKTIARRKKSAKKTRVSPLHGLVNTAIK